MSTVGNAISRDAHTAVSQQVYETLQPKIQVLTKLMSIIYCKT